MTDKQIIIDGVDVSGCPHYIHKDGSCSSHDCECVKCVHNVCFYKDYKAKEQECEELKKIIDEAKNSKLVLKSFLVGEAVQNEYEKQLDQLKTENEELRQFLSKEPLALQALQSAYSSYRKSSDVFYEMVKDYKQALTEIKEIAEEYEELHGFLDCSGDLILQKIREVEDEDTTS